MIRDMSAILYPVAANAEQALSRPLGRAARERAAGAVAKAAVVFATEPVGPAFSTREAALAAYAGRVDDERTGAGPGPEDRYCRLAEQVIDASGRAPGPVEPTFEGGRRWPAPPAQAPRTAWRLQVSYWRIATAERPIDAPQARKARRSAEAERLDPATLRAMSRQPLRPVEPQRPLDIGLFETRLPEAPHIIVPDE